MSGESPDGELPEDAETVATVILKSDEASPLGEEGEPTRDTRVDVPRVDRPQKAAPDAVAPTKIASQDQVILIREAERFRAFLSFSALMSVIGGGAVALLGTDPASTRILAGMCAAVAVTALVFLPILRDPKRYRGWMNVAFGGIAANAVLAAFYFFGVASAALMIMPLGIYLMALGENLRAALVTHIYVSLGHLVLSVLLILRWIPDVGLVQVASGSTASKLGLMITIQVVLLASFVIARRVRGVNVATLEQLNIALTDNARRAALLDEAKQELAQARKVGGEGRFSEQVFGGFRLGNVLGRGAMGEVYEALHVKTKEGAAVKVLSFDSMRRPDIVARFRREMDISQSLRHANVVSILAVSQPGDEIPYFVMEKLSGQSLAEVLREEGTLKPEECAQLVSALGKGVEAAHAKGVIHRDLKPSNIFLHAADGSKVWKVLDFGISKFVDDGDTLTAGAIVGTPGYMSPEQAQGLPVTERSDIYALGVVAYRALTGRPAFGGNDLAAVVHAVVYEMPPRPSEVASLSADMDAFMAIAIAKNPESRFASAGEMAHALALAARGELSEKDRARGRTLMRTSKWHAAT